jgi:hypothetical protein
LKETETSGPFGKDGQCDRAAWKTDAFYGNPLTGFTALP